MNPTIFYGDQYPIQRAFGMTRGGMSQPHLQPERVMNYKARTGASLQIDCI
jgi:hypothetical protein